MFTGLIQHVGEVRSVTPRGEGVDLTIQLPGRPADCEIGDSINCNGCCLTVTDFEGGAFSVHAGSETLDRSTIRHWRPSTLVNIEPALAAGARLGGHFVQGHVDGVGRILSITREGETTRWRFKIPDDLTVYIVNKGSIAIDGISLTITTIQADEFEVAIIPHTLNNTNLRSARPGKRVNIEVDILAKYVRNMLAATNEPKTGITEQLLRDQGFC